MKSTKLMSYLAAIGLVTTIVLYSACPSRVPEPEPEPIPFTSQTVGSTSGVGGHAAFLDWQDDLDDAGACDITDANVTD